ncbi:glutathionylspermidine synthase family protein [Halonatronum saccharophilum]|uniref:glutathionylspermidine synthase family protein n=1 Tax=Halonatronum saccharophilum TaxID=150060 RepID=UPI0004836FC3|nr:glutathionylspermidine synthase family protein [Halonatronum saccharophilum]
MNSPYSHYKEILLENPNRYKEDYERIFKELEDSPAYYGGKVIPFLYRPLFFKEKELETFEEISSKLKVILKKVVHQYLEDKEFRSYFGFSKELEELILVDPGYSGDFPMARFDIFYYGEDDIKFCELNADGSSGMVKTNTLEENFLEAEAVKVLTKSYNVDYKELIDTWVDTLLRKYNEFNSKGDRPNIGIMDFSGYGMVKEFEHFKKVIEERGYRAKIVDPRNLEYKEGALFSGDFRVDLIYRRAVTMDLMEHYDEIGDLLKAYQEGKVCLVGPIRSQIIHNKVLFSILHDEDRISFLNKEEKEFIKKTIPYTRVLDPNNKELLTYAKDNREGLVLKPLDLYGAEGVTIGKDTSNKVWRERIDALEDKTHLIQEFCLVPQLEMPVFEGEKIEFKPYKYTLGLFLYDEQIKGIYTRASKENVIASVTGCVTLANFVCKEKR